MQKIIDLIRQKGTAKAVAPGEIIKSRHNGIFLCHLIESGIAVIFADIHERPLRTVYGPHIIGLNQLFHPQEGLAFKMIHPSVVYSIPVQQLLTMIEENGLWSELAVNLSELVLELSVNARKRKTDETADVVYKILQSLQDESEEVRISHTVNDYVRYLTGLSASTVSRTIDTFKKEHCIEVQNGVLIRLHKRDEPEKT
ncbi:MULTISPECIES: helix-turn-helix domain-containing protein [unclassified Enterobacter cloacae complex]|uniref:helix-turn-helix domain-containing protein n=1 Tax=unclassified Enterobacter cloacae complex TaxID=2757714 RepID=UPI0018722134|nr:MULTISPECIES: helix-turn-helix domain-containing protein [unclassified Enterobacter cloacae complex]MBE4810072.1 helix-turn-helix domain-containing protein [Enterobacter cloacae complex sp. P44RS]MBE4827944.1 helix-turn-helix domain-containing protein [Enterobacter cloacae complex sp. P42RS]MBE4836250.1 helix-turn-helix domain-containing protein [Enterobacter cloacae complex sp. P46RS]MBE4839849.1 helix-turn-helix domain-containing protein [Enterobacter cloacae complex sp. P42C]